MWGGGLGGWDMRSGVGATFFGMAVRGEELRCDQVLHLRRWSKYTVNETSSLGTPSLGWARMLLDPWV